MITMTKDPLATHAPQNHRPNSGRLGRRFLNDSETVPEVGLEPTRPFGRRILSRGGACAQNAPSDFPPIQSPSREHGGHAEHGESLRSDPLRTHPGAWARRGRRLALALVLGALAGCSEPDGVPVAGEPGPDGGVVATEQAVVGPTWVHFVEDRKVLWPVNYEMAAVLRSPNEGKMPYYFNSPNVYVTWEYQLDGGSWAPIAGMTPTPAQATVVDVLAIGNGLRGCFENVGCVALFTPMANSTSYHHDITWNRGWRPAGVDPNAPHTVKLRRSYGIMCPDGHVAATSFAKGIGIDLATTPDQTIVTMTAQNPAAGAFGAATLWAAIADQCNYGQEAFAQRNYQMCDCRRNPPVYCFGWPNALNCNADSMFIQQCAGMCGH